MSAAISPRIGTRLVAYHAARALFIIDKGHQDIVFEEVGTILESLGAVRDWAQKEQHTHEVLDKGRSSTSAAVRKRKAFTKAGIEWAKLSPNLSVSHRASIVARRLVALDVIPKDDEEKTKNAIRQSWSKDFSVTKVVS
jgi:hypothetical protein